MILIYDFSGYNREQFDNIKDQCFSVLQSMNNRFIMVPSVYTIDNGFSYKSNCRIIDHNRVNGCCSYTEKINALSSIKIETEINKFKILQGVICIINDHVQGIMIYDLLHDIITFLSEPNCDLIGQYREVAVNYILNYVVDVVSDNNLYDPDFWIDKYNNYLDSNVGLEAGEFTNCYNVYSLVVNVMRLTIPGLYYVSKGSTLDDIVSSVRRNMNREFNDDNLHRLTNHVKFVLDQIESYKGISEGVDTYEFVEDEESTIFDNENKDLTPAESTDVPSEVNKSDKLVEYDGHIIKINVDVNDDKDKLPSKNELNTLLDVIAEIVTLLENDANVDAHTSQQMKDMLPLIIRCKRILRR